MNNLNKFCKLKKSFKNERFSEHVQMMRKFINGKQCLEF